MEVDNKSSPLKVHLYSTTIGALKINYVIYFYLAIILAAPAYSYHMAVKQKQEPPFPHATVTNTACHYPQATFFRWAMTSAAGFLTLIFHVIFRFFEKESKHYEYPGTTYAYMYWPTILSVLGYLAAISTIDIGGTGDFHTIGAVYFFICLYFCVVNLTIVSRNLRNWDCRFMSKTSLTSKIIVAGYLSIVFVYCLVGLILENTGGKSNDDDIYIVIIEWNLVYAGLIWILCFLGDMKNVSLVLKTKPTNPAITQVPQT